MSQPREWLIRHGDLFWRHEGNGYTNHLHQAGLFTKEKAEIIERSKRVPPDKPEHITEYTESIKEDLRFARRMCEALKRAEARKKL